MAYKNKANLAKAPAPPSYDDFEPKFELKEEEDVDTLIIFLPGFKKEQLRVQASNNGILTVTGEKRENSEGTIKRRFVKETKVPNGCDINEIHAKFTNGELRVIMPKEVMTTPPVAAGEPRSEITSTDHKQKANNVIENAKMSGLGTTLARLQVRKSNNVVIGFGVVVAAMVVVGAYVAYKYGSSSVSSYMEE